MKKLLKDAQYVNELKKKSNVSDTGCIDGEFVESIMCNIPNISNRNIPRTLTILRRKLPKKHFQANLKKVIQQRLTDQQIFDHQIRTYNRWFEY